MLYTKMHVSYEILIYGYIFKRWTLTVLNRCFFNYCKILPSKVEIESHCWYNWLCYQVFHCIATSAFSGPRACLVLWWRMTVWLFAFISLARESRFRLETWPPNTRRLRDRKLADDDWLRPFASLQSGKQLHDLFLSSIAFILHSTGHDAHSSLSAKWVKIVFCLVLSYLFCCK